MLEPTLHAKVDAAYRHAFAILLPGIARRPNCSEDYDL